MKRILVALDGSVRAPLVVEAALRLSERMDATMIVFRAIGIPPDLPRDVLAMTDTTLEDVLRNNAHTDLERLSAAVPRTRLEKIVTAIAMPCDGICSAAREQDVDLIVIGSHGYHGLDRILGTTAGKVVNRSDRNVLVVRTPL
jgi:universal stress protein F